MVGMEVNKVGKEVGHYLIEDYLDYVINYTDCVPIMLNTLNKFIQVCSKNGMFE
jgi:hypothetical protein